MSALQSQVKEESRAKTSYMVCDVYSDVILHVSGVLFTDSDITGEEGIKCFKNFWKIKTREGMCVY